MVQYRPFMVGALIWQVHGLLIVGNGAGLLKAQESPGRIAQESLLRGLSPGEHSRAQPSTGELMSVKKPRWAQGSSEERRGRQESPGEPRRGPGEIMS